MPTGGATSQNARRYLAPPDVVCVSGTWMLDPQAIILGDWEEIERL
ncbi:hypothetical protein Q6D67_18945 [Haliea sp. E1-2-M8]|nr:hypothetical protein [Haliea sp. E1-2-M8]MDO8863774.1 hypothetical protein [Haliea sp. E1-2-M8]